MISRHQTKIGVSPATAYQAHEPLFELLSACLPLEFEPFRADWRSEFQGVLILSSADIDALSATAPGISCYHVVESDDSAARASSIKFGASSSLHPVFRNREFTDPAVKKFSAVQSAGEILAEADGHPLWTVERMGGKSCHHIGISLPDVTADEFFHEHFRSNRWFAMVALLHFLREVLGPGGWPTPEPRASFIIDDPNLHHRGYGFIDFPELIRHASTNGYHATIATVPLDSWYFDRKVAALFRENKKFVSLMVHGVHHVADELARPYNTEQAVRLLAAGLKRISAFESRSGVSVARVMAAPHGAFAESIADPMVQVGFESACVSVGSLHRWNPGKKWLKNFGFAMAQSFGTQGFPIFHRTGVNAVDVCLLSFLGNPIVIATHHQDCVSNFALFEKLAGIVNDIPGIRWMPIEDISRTNYFSHLEGDVLHIRPFSRKFVVPRSSGIATIVLEPSPYGAGATIRPEDHRAQSSTPTTANSKTKIKVMENAVEITFPPANAVDYRKVRSTMPGVWPVVRRFLAEGRDRVKPMLSFGAAR